MSKEKKTDFNELEKQISDIIKTGNIKGIAETLNAISKEVIRLYKECDRLGSMNQYHMEKAEKWETRARELYKELHGKDAPPQG